jgi:two-component system sensor histidine kinase VicK
MKVTILEKDQTVGNWLLKQLTQIHIPAKWLPTVADLLAESEDNAPTVCLIALRPPVTRALSLITELTQEPRFSKTAFVLMGPAHFKHPAFEAGADDYLTTPPDVIELRKRVRLYLDRAALETRVVAETRLSQKADAARARNPYEMILAHTTEAISCVAPDGTLTYANPTWKEMIGTPSGLRVGEPVPWPPVTDSPITNRAMANAIEHLHPWQDEADFTLPDGTRLKLATSIQPAFDDHHELAGFVVTQQNITERRAPEPATTRFFSEIAYQLRTPVTNLKMRQYLLSQAPDDQRATHLEIMERETEHLAHLVESMLELSRLDAGITEFSLQPLDLNRLVSEALIRYGPLAKSERVTLLTEHDEPLPLVEADATQLARALGILIENAIQHTPETGRILIRPVPEAWSGGSFLTLQVTDTGTGITRAAQPHIFERFYRNERSIEAGIEGVGLGLSIAQEIVERHNGYITVESEVDQGSTFTIWLPAREAT